MWGGNAERRSMDREELLNIAKPILFNTDMVRAILDGRKTVTRRCVKFLNGKNPNWTGYVKDGLLLYNGTNQPCIKPCQYQPGDILYIRETWCNDRQFTKDSTPGRYFYKASESEDFTVKWKPSIHMPKEAARIFLKVKDVRVERLQDITDEEAKREGSQPQNPFEYDVNKWPNKEHFKEIWNSTVKKSDIDRYGWDANPWVWVIEFERIELTDNLEPEWKERMLIGNLDTED